LRLLILLLALLRARSQSAPQPPQPPATVPSDIPATEHAWRVHAAIVDWTGKVDQKASFALAVESAVLLGVIAASNRDSESTRLLSTLDNGLEVWTYRTGTVLLVLAIVLAMATVIPQLRRGKLNDEWRDNWIFFGHVQHWDEPDLTRALRNRDTLPVLSRQLIVMSKIAWKKHRRLQRSLLSAIVGAALIGIAALTDSRIFENLF
jgi:hypothetical protein